MAHGTLILVALAGIALLLFLVMHTKLQAFVALLLVSLLVGTATGMPLNHVLDSIKNGMGGTLGFVAVVVGLGAMFGGILDVSGGVDRLGQELIRKLGEDRAQWALGLTGFIISIPVFFEVGFIIIVPLVYGLTRKTGRSLLYYGIPLVAGLAVTHAFIPPTPGPIAVADLLGADLGWVILFGAIAGLPAMAIAGPLYGRFIARRLQLGVPEYMELKAPKHEDSLPAFGAVIAIIAVPLLLILLNTFSAAILSEGNTLRAALTFLGHPFVALIIATLLAFYFLGSRQGFSREEVNKIATKALEPAGLIILITGAGGVFKQVLIDSGVGDVLGEAMAGSVLPPVALAFIISAVVRIAQGSATVAMITSAGIMAPILGTLHIDGAMRGLMVIAIAAGATILSHVNDSGFWLVKQYFGMSEKDTLRSWTVMETIIAGVGIAMVLLLAQFV